MDHKDEKYPKCFCVHMCVWVVTEDWIVNEYVCNAGWHLIEINSKWAVHCSISQVTDAHHGQNILFIQVPFAACIYQLIIQQGLDLNCWFLSLASGPLMTSGQRTQKVLCSFCCNFRYRAPMLTRIFSPPLDKMTCSYHWHPKNINNKKTPQNQTNPPINKQTNKENQPKKPYQQEFSLFSYLSPTYCFMADHSPLGKASYYSLTTLPFICFSY